MLESIQVYINSLSEEDFFKYLSPQSYYNTPLKYAFCSNYTEIEPRYYLNLYFFMKENQDEISQMVFDKMFEFIEFDENEEVEFLGLDWSPLVSHMLKDKHGYLSTSKSYMEKLIDLNENFDKKSYYIINDITEQESVYTDKLVDCAYWFWNRDRPVDYDKLIKNEELKCNGMSMKKGDLILFSDFKKIEPSHTDFYKSIQSEFNSYNREIKLNKLFNESRILSFRRFKHKV